MERPPYGEHHGSLEGLKTPIERHEIKVHGGTARYIIANPDSDHGDIFLAPGFLSGLRSQRDVQEYYANEGYRVTSISHARHGGDGHESEYSDEIVQPADTINAILGAHGMDEAHLIGHSAGFYHAIIAAEREDEQRIASITGIAPAGVADFGRAHKQVARTSRLAWNGLKEMSKNPNRSRLISEAARYIGSNALRTGRDMDRLYNGKVHEEMTRVSQRIPVSIIILRNDMLFTTGNYMKSLDQLDMNEMDGFDIATFLDPEASHAAYLQDSDVMDAVLEKVQSHMAREL